MTGDMYTLPGRPSLRFDSLKDWTVKYLQFTWNVTQLRRGYAPTRTAPEILRSNIEMTFSSCWGLTDWLVAGPEPRTVTAGDVARLAEADPLRVCKALVARTGPATAHIVDLHIGDPARVWIEFEQPGKRPIRFDALDLAERCLMAWNRFLRDRRVALPRWNYDRLNSDA